LKSHLSATADHEIAHVNEPLVKQMGRKEMFTEKHPKLFKFIFFFFFAFFCKFLQPYLRCLFL
jgi:hypothetical protein